MKPASKPQQAFEKECMPPSAALFVWPFNSAMCHLQLSATHDRPVAPIAFAALLFPYAAVPATAACGILFTLARLNPSFTLRALSDHSLQFDGGSVHSRFAAVRAEVSVLVVFVRRRRHTLFTQNTQTNHHPPPPLYSATALILRCPDEDLLPRPRDSDQHFPLPPILVSLPLQCHRRCNPHQSYPAPLRLQLQYQDATLLWRGRGVKAA